MRVIGAEAMRGETPDRLGPILFFRGLEGGRLRLAAVVVRPEGETPPAIETEGGPAAPRALLAGAGRRAFGYSFTLPAGGPCEYRFEGETYPVNAAYDGDLRLAYASCNGQEHGDRDRDPAERNAMWACMAAEHAERPFHLLLHGGDQLYADEILECHPAVQAWAKRARPKDVDAATAEDARAALHETLFERYLQTFAEPPFDWLSARIPSLAMWDDHDICDGWGSLPAVKLDRKIGEVLFEVARACFLVFQMGAHPEETPSICIDQSGRSLGWRAALPGVDLIAPDLRSERRPWRVMGKRGWAGFLEATRAAAERPDGGRAFILSSVPALGPRLSWVEAVMILTPTMQKYEDDLRDQWQSRAHRDEWKRFLQTVIDLHRADGRRATLLSGEIHLATRGTLAVEGGPVHQLVASGVTHPAPAKGYARGLGLLASLGEAPLPAHPIALRPLPGQRATYVAQRNYLVLARDDGAWTARWELEEDGPTPALQI